MKGAAGDAINAILSAAAMNFQSSWKLFGAICCATCWADGSNFSTSWLLLARERHTLEYRGDFFRTDYLSTRSRYQVAFPVLARAANTCILAGFFTARNGACYVYRVREKRTLKKEKAR